MSAMRLYNAEVDILPGAVGAVVSITAPALERLLELLDLELLDFEVLSDVALELEEV